MSTTPVPGTMYRAVSAVKDGPRAGDVVAVREVVSTDHPGATGDAVVVEWTTDGTVNAIAVPLSRFAKSFDLDAE